MPATAWKPAKGGTLAITGPPATSGAPVTAGKPTATGTPDTPVILAEARRSANGLDAS
jgi:hypothetical protein